ncbi:MAG: hypothetical protein JWP98_382 [Edaphobacter sp.]|nr:hypothetical protein [Edaphobacter sp.]
MRGLWVIPLTIALSVASAYGQGSSKSLLVTPEDRHNAKLLVRPCTPKESAPGSSLEVIRLFSGRRPVFNWCEALDVSWLPNANILRFHTAVDVDYSYTYTIIKAASESPIWLVVFGEGLVAQPSANPSLDAMNDLLRSAQPMPNDSQLESASILYLFLVGRENHHGFFRRPESQHPLSTADYRESYRKNGVIRVVRLTTPSGEWKFTFSLQGQSLHLDSVVDNGGN